MVNFTKKFIIKKYKYALFLALLLVFSFSAPFQAKALIAGPFGGPILSIFPCINGLSIKIGPPVGGTFFLTAGSIIYAFGQIHPGAWVLGMAAGPAVCFYFSGDDLKSFSSGGIILFLGTSK